MKCEEVIDLFLNQIERQEADNSEAMTDRRNKLLVEDDWDKHLAQDPVEIQIQSHLGSCDTCRRKIEELSFLLKAMQNQPEPETPTQMTGRFEAFIRDQNGREAQGAIVRKLSRQLWMAASLILIVGLSILFVVVNQKANKPSAGTQVVQQQVLNESLFSNASASVRIQAITQVDTLTGDVQLLNTLSNILLTDKNSNVRMAALYSLSAHLSNSKVYAVFINALKTEKDPVLQVLLINTLAQQKNPKGAEALQSLINDSATRSEVRTVAEQTLKTI